MKYRFLLAAAAVPAFFFSMGCGDPCGDGADRISGACAESLETACEQYATQYCEKRQECSNEARMILVGYGPAEVCAADLARQCRIEAALEGSLLTPGGLQSCTSAISAPGCGVLEDFPEACTFAGSLEPGEPCVVGSQCATTQCNLMSDFCGVCAYPVEVEERGSVGSACEVNFQCDVALICVDGKCGVGQGEGEDCSSLPCNSKRGLYCDAQSLTCKPYQIVQTGQSCAQEVNLTCDFDALCDGSTLVCVALPGEGQPCYSYQVCYTDPDGVETCDTYGGYCAHDTWCDVNNVCVRWSKLGEECAGDGDCGDWFTSCIDGVCTPDAAALCGG